MLQGACPSVVFLMPPGGRRARFSEHLGTAFLRTMLARAGVPTEQYLPERNVSLDGFGRHLAEIAPPVVGFTAYESNLGACRSMARVVREALPDAVVMVGGPNATFTPEETLELLQADLCLRGAGEGTIVAVVEAILGAEHPRRRLPGLLAGIPNLAFMTPDGVQHTRAAELSSFPAGYFHHLDDIPSPYQAGFVTTTETGLLTARGCNQACTYCSFATISGRRVHHHGVDRVLDDVAALKVVFDRSERRPSSVPIFDDAFSLAPQRARAICEGIVERELQMPFMCMTRADRVDEDLLRLMKRAGFVEVGFGLESAVPRVLRTIGKVQDPATAEDPGFEAEGAFLESVRRAVSAARRLGLATPVSVIGGLPGETAEDLRSTLAFVESLQVPEYTHNLLKLFPGTSLHRDRERFGLEAGRDPVSRLWRTDHAYDARSVPHLTTSSRASERWDEAHEITDALCGRPASARACDEAAWAVVLHACEPEAGLARWLSQVLAVHGAVVAVEPERSCGPPDLARWLHVLHEADVPRGLFALLSRETCQDGCLVLTSAGTDGQHRFEIGEVWESSGRGVDADEAGRCRVPIWIASGARAPPPGHAPAALQTPVPQIADGCRWWSSWRRCAHPRVLHVWPDAKVTPCWHGPAIGSVGEVYSQLLARSKALTREAERDGTRALDPCPQARENERGSRDGAAAISEIAAQVAWLRSRTPPALAVNEEVGHVDAIGYVRGND